MRHRPILAALSAGVMLAASACTVASARTSPSPLVTAASMRLLPGSAVPDIPYTTKALTASNLARDASIQGLASRIVAWGYLDGRQRTFQGESRHLTLVVSRSLVFKDDAGARVFVNYVHAKSPAFFGGAVGNQTLVAQGRSGWLFTPAPCACHMANPDLVGIVPSGARVIWLEINGPDATPELLVSLLGDT